MNRRNNQCSHYEDKETETLHYTKIIDDQPRPSKSQVVSIEKKKTRIFVLVCFLALCKEHNFPEIWDYIR